MSAETSPDQAAASALGSVRAEGLEPGGRAEIVLAAWSTGALSDAELDEIASRVAARTSIDDLLPFAEAPR